MNRRAVVNADGFAVYKNARYGAARGNLCFAYSKYATAIYLELIKRNIIRILCDIFNSLIINVFAVN